MAGYVVHQVSVDLPQVTLRLNHIPSVILQARVSAPNILMEQANVGMNTSWSDAKNKTTRSVC